eukprot:TRINITY_DN3131_c0_g1_i2.p2 TRINITY_DN3131_c0_g1~~TRINITY_DN3131_c0_g1_i2.p2  ORF type:complete len:213 (+),score=77.01 TRINITY_DN3131_c0_g1_i2:64-639(+)
MSCHDPHCAGDHHHGGPPPPPRIVCAQCGLDKEELKLDSLSICAGCHGVFYCSVDHQRENWKAHKATCKIFKALNPNNGFQKVTSQEGDQKFVLRKKSEVSFHYRARTPDGFEFDNSYARGQPVRLTLGKKSLVRGLDEGIMTMSKGEISCFYIHPSWAYGDPAWAATQPPSIPQNSPVIFDVELLEIHKK